MAINVLSFLGTLSGMDNSKRFHKHLKVLLSHGITCSRSRATLRFLHYRLVVLDRFCLSSHNQTDPNLSFEHSKKRPRFVSQKILSVSGYGPFFYVCPVNGLHRTTDSLERSVLRNHKCLCSWHCDHHADVWKKNSRRSWG